MYSNFSILLMIKIFFIMLYLVKIFFFSIKSASLKIPVHIEFIITFSSIIFIYIIIFSISSHSHSFTCVSTCNFKFIFIYIYFYIILFIEFFISQAFGGDQNNRVRERYYFNHVKWLK